MALAREEKELRQVALRKAVEWAESRSSTSLEITDAAEVFYKFLSGK